MALVIAEPLHQYQTSANTTEPATANDNGASAWAATTTLYVSDTGRFGGRVFGSGNMGHYSIRLPSGYTEKTLVIGGWFKWNPNDTTTDTRTFFMALRNSALNWYHWVLSLSSSGNLYVTGSASSATASPVGYAQSPLTAGVWHYIEVKAFQDNSSGYVQVRVDGVEVLNVSGFDTQDNTTVGAVQFGGQRSDYSWEDIVIMDSTGAAFNDFMGDMRFETVPVDDDGTITNWTPTSGSNYTTIDDTIGTPNDADYIESSTTDQDNYALHTTAAAPNHSDIYFVQLMARAKADASDELIALQVNSNGTVDRGPDQPLVNGTWRYRRQIWPTDPDTTDPWELAAINAAEFGVRKRV